jgi:fluoroacetyl-CoA thioesterase
MSESPYERVVAGLRGNARLTVSERHTATFVGSGSVDVLATPEMICLMEQAAVAAVDHLLPDGLGTVGVHLDVSHLAPTPPGMDVTATAELIAVDGRKLEFRVEAHDERDLVGRGTHQRMIIHLERFQAGVEEKASGL